MQVAIVCAGFTPGEADQLRRSMATFKVTGGIAHFKDRLIDGMVERGYSREFAEHTVSQIEGFGSYGFPESHAAVLRADRLCLELDEMPPSRRVLRRAAERAADGVLRAGADRAGRARARRRGPAGLRQCQPLGLHAGAGGRPVLRGAAWPAHGQGAVERAGREHRRRAWRPALRLASTKSGGATSVPPAALELLAEADGFQGMGLDRRSALWAIRGLRDEVLPLFAAADNGRAPRPEIVEPPRSDRPDDRRAAMWWRTTRRVGLTLRRHPVAFLRGDLARQRIIPCRDLLAARDGQRLTVAGLVLVRQRPGRRRASCSSPSRTRPASPTSSSGPACSNGSAALFSPPACSPAMAACSARAR